MKNSVQKTKFLVFLTGILLGCFFSFGAEAAVLGETRNFFLDSSYDFDKREEAAAILVLETNKLYFYIDSSFWQQLPSDEKAAIISNLSNLAGEFENKIYPILTSNYGTEWNPGIDRDPKITVLFHRLKKGAGGYFRTGDEYSKILVSISNEREMVYLNTDYITSSLIKSFLSHEFVHLITFNQKERVLGIEEDIWLNEARAEYAPTLLGYDAQYQGSNLQRRVNEFSKNPSDSITDWNNSSADYGVVNVFIQYLLDHYGTRILTDSLHSSKKGIESINEALAKNGFQENFSQIFTNWTIAVLVNDCSLGKKYCYKNENLKNLRIVPATNFLPFNSQSVLSVNFITRNWTGNWQRIIGGGGTLTLDFNGGLTGNIKVPYVVCDVSDVCSVTFLALDNNQIGKIKVQDFNKQYASLTIIPSAQGNSNSNYYFSWEVKMNPQTQDETQLINQLLAQIAALKAEIARVQAQIDAILGKKTTSCQRFENNLYFGLTNNQEVRCLQEFLKKQGADIYPEGLVTGNFLALTKNAVIRFQEKYTGEILAPLGLTNGTGYIGPATRTKINQLLSESTN